MMTWWLVGLLLLGASAVLADIAIATPAGADEVTRFAAAELKRYLDEAAGMTVCRGDEGAELQISVGADPRLPADADPETLVIEAAPDGVLLTGQSPGAVLYAVYGFLEDVIGCRWFYPGEDLVPRLGEAGVKRALSRFASSRRRRVEAPHFPVRMRRFLVYDLGKSGTPPAEQAMREMLLEIDWMAKNRLNIFQFALDHNWDCYTHWPRVREAFPEMQKRGIIPGTGGHNMHMFMRPEDLEAHPDWMPFHGGKRQPRGQFCTRNEAAVRHYLDGLSKFLAENPEIGYFAPWPNDTGGWCECDKCKDTPMPDRFMQLGRRMFEELKARHPHVRVTHFAYGSHMQPPADERPVPGMTVTLCTWGRDLSQPFDSEGTSQGFRETFAAWRDICAEPGVPLVLHEKYARHLYLGQHTVPLPALQADMRWFTEQGLAGFELPMAYMGRRTKGLNLHVLARLMWDVRAPTDEIVADYFGREYGPLAGTMRSAYEDVERAMDDYRYSFHNYSKLGLQLKPGMQVGAAWREYADGARRAIADVQSRIDDVAALKASLTGEPDDGEAILARVGLLRRSLEYLEVEWEGLAAVGRAGRAMAIAELAETQDEYLRRLDEAAAAIKQAQEHDARRREMAQNTADLPLFWDVTGHGISGVFDGRSLEGWLKLIDERRKIDVASLPRKVWQIGAFDGSGAELGDEPDQRDVMLKMPEVVRYEVPADWLDRGEWPDFPRSHWPQSLHHGARIELVFAASRGRHRLVVGQWATGQPETVSVLFDGAQIGSYTTVAGQNATHEVEFEIEADGEHELVLAEFAQGGGYMFDAIRLERLPGD